MLSSAWAMLSSTRAALSSELQREESLDVDWEDAEELLLLLIKCEKWKYLYN